MIMLTNSPKGPLTIPTAVAILLSLSPNQLLASFVTGFLKKAWELKQIIWPKNQNQREIEVNKRSTLPRMRITDPSVIHFLRPWFSMIQIDAKFIGRYIIRSEYLAQSSIPLSKVWSILVMIGLFVLKEPDTLPTAADVKKNEIRTIQRYLYRIRDGFSFSFKWTWILS